MLKCTSNLPARKIAHSVHEAALDKARAIANTEACDMPGRQRKKVEMLFARLERSQTQPTAPGRPERRERRVPRANKLEIIGARGACCCINPRR
jgi:hypothetical protein